MRVQLKVKSNGHHVCTKYIKRQSLPNELIYFSEKYRLPLNISINQIRSMQEQHQLGLGRAFSVDEGIYNNNSNSISNGNGHSISNSNNEIAYEEQEQYDISVLAEQVTLFESDKQIQQYIATQKILAHDVQQKLSNLCKALILVANKQFQNKRETLSFLKLSSKVEDKDKVITKEQLNQIQEKCMETLIKVKEERRKIELCVVCWENLSSVVFIPCMHFVMCGKCPKVRSCPVCKVVIQSSAPIFR